MNSRRTFIRNSVLASGAIVSGIFSKDLFASGDLTRLTVMHTNDMHCHIDPFPEDHADFRGKVDWLELPRWLINAGKRIQTFCFLMPAICSRELRILITSREI